MKVLITGIGITGKSTFRRLLVEMLKKHGLSVEHFDADKFDEIRHPTDASCLKKLPSAFVSSTSYIIEDIHATLPNAILNLKEYDLIFYLKPSILSQILFWLLRMWRWFQNGHFSWETETGWQGTGKPNDLHNVLPILKNFIRDLKNRKRWVKRDLNKIKIYSLPYQTVKPYWTLKCPRFKITL